MARKQKHPLSETELPQVQEQPPIVTPEIEDGYDGVVKRLYCSTCQQGFYVTEADYQTLSPRTCHACSDNVFREYEDKRFKELAMQERQKEEEERRKKIDEILGFAYIRSYAEEKRDKKAWNYGYTMLYCVELPFNEGRMWRVRIYKDDERSRMSTHQLFLIWEIRENAHMYLPIANRIYPVVDFMQVLTENDPDLSELKFLSENDPELFERKFLEKMYKKES